MEERVLKEIVREVLVSEGWDIDYNFVLNVRPNVLNTIEAVINIGSWVINLTIDSDLENKLAQAASEYKLDGSARDLAKNAIYTVLKHEKGHWEKAPVNVHFASLLWEGSSKGLALAGFPKEKIERYTQHAAMMIADVIVNTAYASDDRFVSGSMTVFATRLILSKKLKNSISMELFVDPQMKLLGRNEKEKALVEKQIANYDEVRNHSVALLSAFIGRQLAEKAFSEGLSVEEKKFALNMMQNPSNWEAASIRYAEVMGPFLSEKDLQEDKKETNQGKSKNSKSYGSEAEGMKSRAGLESDSGDNDNDDNKNEEEKSEKESKEGNEAKDSTEEDGGKNPKDRKRSDEEKEDKNSEGGKKPKESKPEKEEKRGKGSGESKEADEDSSSTRSGNGSDNKKDASLKDIMRAAIGHGKSPSMESGDGAFSDGMKLDDENGNDEDSFRREIIREILERNGAVLFGTKFEVLDESYKKAAGKIVTEFLKDEQEQIAQRMTLVSKVRRLDENEPPTKIAWGKTMFEGKGLDEPMLYKKDTLISTDNPVEPILAGKLKDILFIVDVSGSMGWSGNPLDGSRYDMALQSIYSTNNYLELSHKAAYINYGLMLFSDKTTFSGWKSYAEFTHIKKMAFAGYQGGGTELDLSMLERAETQKRDNFLAILISDNAIMDADAVASKLISMIRRGDSVAVIQTGYYWDSQILRRIRESGGAVMQVSDPTQLANATLSVARNQYQKRMHVRNTSLGQAEPPYSAAKAEKQRNGVI